MNQSRICSLIYICCNGEAMGNMKLSIWLVYHCWSLVFFKNIQVKNVINNVKLLYVNDIQMEFISICIHFHRRYIVRDYGRNKHSLNWKYKLNSLYNWYVVICWHFGRNTDAFMISTKKWNCWWRWLWRIRKEHTFHYSMETFYVWNGYLWKIFLTIGELIPWRYWNEYMFAWKSGQQIGTFGNKIAT